MMTMTTRDPISADVSVSGPADAPAARGERADLLEALAKHRHFLRFTARD
jgi:hypothetical protein